LLTVTESLENNFLLGIVLVLCVIKISWVHHNLYVLENTRDIFTVSFCPRQHFSPATFCRCDILFATFCPATFEFTIVACDFRLIPYMAHGVEKVGERWHRIMSMALPVDLVRLANPSFAWQHHWLNNI